MQDARNTYLSVNSYAETVSLPLFTYINMMSRPLATNLFFYELLKWSPLCLCDLNNLMSSQQITSMPNNLSSMKSKLFSPAIPGNVPNANTVQNMQKEFFKASCEQTPSYTTLKSSPENIAQNYNVEKSRLEHREISDFTDHFDDCKNSHSINIQALKGHKYEIKENPDAKSSDGNYMYICKYDG